MISQDTLNWSDGEYDYVIIEESSDKTKGKVEKLHNKIHEFQENYGSSTRVSEISHQLKMPTFCCLNLGGSSRRYRRDGRPDLGDRVGYAIVGTVIAAAAAYFVGKELVTYNQSDRIIHKAAKIKNDVGKNTNEYKVLKRTLKIFREFKRHSMISLAFKVTFAAGGAVLAVGAVINAVPLMAAGGVALVIGAVGTIGHYGYRSFSDPALVKKMEKNLQDLHDLTPFDLLD